MLDKLKSILKGSGAKSTEPVQQDIVGVDISHSYVRTISLKKKNKQWSLNKISTKALDDSYENEEKRREAIVTNLKNIKLEQKFDSDNAAISLPVNSAIVQVVQIPYLEEEELKEAADNGSLWDTSINVPGELSEYSIFWQTIKKDREKNTLSLLFVASRVDEIEKNCDLVRSAGYDPLIVDVRCFALRNILKTYEESESSKTQVFIEISAQENYAVCMFDNLPFIYDIYVSDTDVESLLKGGSALDKELFSRLASQIRTSVTSFIKQSGVPGIEKIELSSSLPIADKIFKSLKDEILEYKIEMMSPFNFVKIPPQFKSRVEQEKNLSSLAVAVGLATRQLDVFGYYKFVTAVSNINLLPDREDRVKKEQKKSKTTSLMKKLSMVSGAFLIFAVGLYGFLITTLPSDGDILAMQKNASDTQKTLNKKKKQFKDLSKWTYDSGLINNKILDISYTASFPRGSFITKVVHLRNGNSIIEVKVNDPGLSADIMSGMSKKFKNVQLLNIKAPRSEKTNMSTLEISFEIK
ncbi:pilus assembly protein PilM [Nitrosomonadales bacterium]|nr:pilus assembly protein PilM [Nitrosomonadales bacterium]